jgi:hypothetical protein
MLGWCPVVPGTEGLSLSGEDAVSALRVPWSQRPKTEKVAKAGFIDPKLRRAVFERAGGCCEFCADRLEGSWECHHRKLRSRGGLDSACNLIALHHFCHRRLHSHNRFATEHGFVVSTYDDPMTAPLNLRLDGSPVLLTADGCYRHIEEVRP